MMDNAIFLEDIDAVKNFLTQGDEESIQEVIFTQGEVNNEESE